MTRAWPRTPVAGFRGCQGRPASLRGRPFRPRGSGLRPRYQGLVVCWGTSGTSGTTFAGFRVCARNGVGGWPPVFRLVRSYAYIENIVPDVPNVPKGVLTHWKDSDPQIG